MLVMKFGGTSVGEPGAIRRVSDIVKSRVPLQPAVVVSAVSKTTDELVGLAHAAAAGDVDREAEFREWITTKHARILADLQFEGEEPARLLRDVAAELERVAGQILDLGKVTPELLDDCLSWGEYLSANILAAHLRKEGVPAIWIDSRDFMVTDARFGRARPVFEAARQRALNLILPVMESGQVPVIQGFVGRESGGRTTTFGRGGSDYSATVLGALIEAGCVEIWTDVDGIMTADPSLVAGVRCIRSMTFEEAAELAYFGAKVLHPATIQPAVDRGIPVYVLNSLRPGEQGTRIVKEEESLKPPLVKSIAYKESLSVLNVRSTRMLMAYGFLATIFEIFNRFETPVDLVATSEVSVSVTIDSRERLEEIVTELADVAEVEVRGGQAIVCLVGQGLCSVPGIAARVFSELDGIRINLISQGASRINMSFVIDETDLPEVINRLHRRFFSGTLDERVFAPLREVVS